MSEDETHRACLGPCPCVLPVSETGLLFCDHGRQRGVPFPPPFPAAPRGGHLSTKQSRLWVLAFQGLPVSEAHLPSFSSHLSFSLAREVAPNPSVRALRAGQDDYGITSVACGGGDKPIVKGDRGRRVGGSSGRSCLSVSCCGEEQVCFPHYQ